MKNLIKTIRGIMAIVLVGGFLFSSPMIGEARAGYCSLAGPSCGSCSDSNIGSPCTCSNGSDQGICVAAPEMSDYLAMAFVLVSGGMIYYFRRRTFVKA
jgi:hypothetical protein